MLTGSRFQPIAKRLAKSGELKIENSRLRRLVTDLLLEKLELEESLRASLGSSLN